jgi:hypothetical protein
MCLAVACHRVKGERVRERRKEEREGEGDRPVHDEDV